MKTDETIPLLRALWEEEAVEGGINLSEWVRDIAAYCGVGVSAVWAWYAGTRTPSAAARKLLLLRKRLPPWLVVEIADL